MLCYCLTANHLALCFVIVFLQGKFTLAVSAVLPCPNRTAPESTAVSTVVIAGHLLPSSSWSNFSPSPRRVERIHQSSEEATPWPGAPSGIRGMRNSVRSLDWASSGQRVQDKGDYPDKNIDDSSSSVGSKSLQYLLNRASSSTRISETRDFKQGGDTLLSSGTAARADENSRNTASSSAQISETDDSELDFVQKTRDMEVDSVELSKLFQHRGGWSNLPDAQDVLVPGDLEVMTTDDGELFPSVPTFFRTKGLELWVIVRVVCQDFYFGKSCSRFCRPRDDLIGHFRCSETGHKICSPGWRGEDCGEAVCSELCVPARGWCTRPEVCTCRHGWFGKHCEHCRTHPGCQHGYCRLPGQCLCQRGWVGPLCDVEELFCLNHAPCLHGGTCVNDQMTNYTCSCPNGYTGSHCQTSVCRQGFCLNGGKCQISNDQRVCQCPSNWAGERCQHQLAPSAQERAHTDPHQSCPGTFCPTHPLPSPPLPCSHRACHTLGECSFHPDSQSYRCNCLAPYAGPQCSPVQDPCRTEPCHHGGICVTSDPTSGSFLCQCPSGFTGQLCELTTLEETQLDPLCGSCQNGATCIQNPTTGQFWCQCGSKYTGEFCEIFEEDSSNPCSHDYCLNGGTCLEYEKLGFRCDCPVGFAGRFCQTLTGELCSLVVCQHGGTCLEYDGHFVCSCRRRFEGEFCERRVRSPRAGSPEPGTSSTQEPEPVQADRGDLKSGGCLVVCRWCLLDSLVMMLVGCVVGVGRTVT